MQSAWLRTPWSIPVGQGLVLLAGIPDSVALLCVKGGFWSHIHATQRPRTRFPAVVNLYGSASGFSERTNHSPWRLRRLDGR